MYYECVHFKNLIHCVKIYTKTGDKRMTSLLSGERVLKNNVIVEVVGTLDELSSILGVVLSFEPKSFTKECLEYIQQLCLIIGSEFSNAGKKTLKNSITAKEVKKIEEWIDELENILPRLNSFIIPGGSNIESFLHLSRTVVRRLERRAVEVENVREELLQFINRLSDLIFMLARFEGEKEFFKKTKN